MTESIDRHAIRREHSSLIHLVVLAVDMPEIHSALEQQLAMAEANGWTALASAVRRIVAGERDIATLEGLDDEDRVIVESILEGIRDRGSLPGLASGIDMDIAAPGIAKMISRIRAGDGGEVRDMFDQLLQQLAQADPELQGLTQVLSRVLEGERDADKLTAGLGSLPACLLRRVLSELEVLDYTPRA